MKIRRKIGNLSLFILGSLIIILNLRKELVNKENLAKGGMHERMRLFNQ